MSWKVEVKPAAQKQYLRLDRKTRTRIRRVLHELEGKENPFFHKNVKPLVGRLKGDYRLRVGGWRVLFTPDTKKMVIHVYAILPRGDAYS